MLYMMICKQHRHEEERFWFCQERRFVMPVLEKQIMHLNEMSRLNISEISQTLILQNDAAFPTGGSGFLMQK